MDIDLEYLPDVELESIEAALLRIENSGTVNNSEFSSKAQPLKSIQAQTNSSKISSYFIPSEKLKKRMRDDYEDDNEDELEQSNKKIKKCSKTVIFDEDSCCVDYYRDFIDFNVAMNLKSELERSTKWKQVPVKILGKWIMQPRLIWYMANQRELSYRYAGIRALPSEWQPEVKKICDSVNLITGADFNSCLLNLYADGTKSIGAHSDDERDLGNNQCVASVSLGAVRKFVLRHKKVSQLTSPINQTKYEVMLANGSLLLMSGDTQKKWTHEVPKSLA